MLFVLGLGLLAATSPKILAQVIHYTVTGTIGPSNTYGALDQGDPYVLTFDLNLSAVGVDVNSRTKSYAGAVQNLTFSLTAGATGNYAGGTLSSAPIFVVNDTAGPSGPVDQVALLASPATSTGFSFATATPFPGISWPIDQLYLEFYGDPDRFNFVSGAAQTLGETLGTGANLGSYESRDLVLKFSSFNRTAPADITSVAAAAIPEPSTYALALSGAAMLISVAKRHRKNQ